MSLFLKNIKMIFLKTEVLTLGEIKVGTEEIFS